MKNGDAKSSLWDEWEREFTQQSNLLPLHYLQYLLNRWAVWCLLDSYWNAHISKYFKVFEKILIYASEIFSEQKYNTSFSEHVLKQLVIIVSSFFIRFK